MGEYVKYKDQSAKIGTCENMYYTSYEAMLRALPYLTKKEGNLEPKEYFNYPEHTLWRFPFEDEKEFDFCNVDCFNRTKDFNLNSYYANKIFNYEFEPDTYILSIGQQKVVGDYLMPAFTINDNYNTWSCGTKEDVNLIIEAIKSCNECDDELEAFCNQLEYYSTHKINELSIKQAVSPQDDLLSLFDNIEVNNEQTISDEDIQRCEQFKILFESTSKQLNDWYKIFVDASKKDTNEMFYLEDDYDKVSTRYGRSESDLGKYDLLKFSPLFDIKHIEKLYAKLLRRFENDIVDYFNKTYSLRVSSEEVLKDTSFGEIPDYMNVVSYILSSLKGKTFSEVAQQHIIDDFKNTIYKSDYVNLKSNCITIQSYMYLEDNWNRGYRLSYNSDKRIATVCMAISYFTGSKARFTPNEIINAWDDRDIDISKPYSLNSDKVDSIRFFKNGRLDIKFVDAQTAQSFYTFFQLNSIGQ